jgi:hypothetical protein
MRSWFNDCQILMSLQENISIILKNSVFTYINEWNKASDVLRIDYIARKKNILPTLQSLQDYRGRQENTGYLFLASIEDMATK